nr:retrovirus-related Pol polyprotein from transposon TNT 1-94 [Tanacetum cinerariifolium]
MLLRPQDVGFGDSSKMLSTIVLDLEKTKTAQAKVIADLKKRVKNLERKRRSRTPEMNLFKIGTSRRRSLDYELAARLRAEEQRRKTTNQSSKEESNTNLSDLSSHSTISIEVIVRIKRLLSAVKVTAAGYGFYCWKFFTKADVSTSESAPMITSDSKDDSDNQVPLPPLLKLTGAEPSRLPKEVCNLDSGCSRHMKRVKQYMHGYSKESGSKVVFRDNSSGDTEGYGSINCNGITFTKNIGALLSLKYVLELLHFSIHLVGLVEVEDVGGDE